MGETPIYLTTFERLCDQCGWVAQQAELPYGDPRAAGSSPALATNFFQIVVFFLNQWDTDNIVSASRNFL